MCVHNELFYIAYLIRVYSGNLTIFMEMYNLHFMLDVYTTKKIPYTFCLVVNGHEM